MTIPLTINVSITIYKMEAKIQRERDPPTVDLISVTPVNA